MHQQYGSGQAPEGRLESRRTWGVAPPEGARRFGRAGRELIGGSAVGELEELTRGEDGDPFEGVEVEEIPVACDDGFGFSG